MWSAMQQRGCPARLTRETAEAQMQALPGGRVVASADETGLIAAVDLRMVGDGNGKRSLLWQSRNPSGGVTCMTNATRPSDGEALLLTTQMPRSERFHTLARPLNLPIPNPDPWLVCR